MAQINISKHAQESFAKFSIQIDGIVFDKETASKLPQFFEIVGDSVCELFDGVFDIKNTIHTKQYNISDADYLLEAIRINDLDVLSGVVTQLKQSDGESWTVGEMLERAIQMLRDSRLKEKGDD